MIKRWAYKQIVSTGVHGEQPRSRAPSMRAANTSHNGEHCIAGFYMYPENQSSCAIPLTPPEWR